LLDIGSYIIASLGLRTPSTNAEIIEILSEGDYLPKEKRETYIKISEAPRPLGGASRKGNLIYIVPLDPAYKAGLAGHLPVNSETELCIFITILIPKHFTIS